VAAAGCVVQKEHAMAHNVAKVVHSGMVSADNTA